MWRVGGARRRLPQSFASAVRRGTRDELPRGPAQGGGDRRRDAPGGSGINGDRVRGLVVVLWRAGLRIGEALDLHEGDLEPARGALLIREGKGGRRREVGMDNWGWEHLRPWLSLDPPFSGGVLSG